MTEKQITEEILRYLKDKSYNYAALIDGEWGSGKTFFVNRTLTKAIKGQEEKLKTNRSVKYISLYGCKNMTDVLENVAWSFAEDARKKIQRKMKWGATAEKVTGNLVHSSQKIGNVIMKKFLSEESLYKISTDWLNLGSFIFIFDDLERCDCPINEVLGFLNELVEHENTKVIIIANENELSDMAETQYLELQYYLTLDDRIQWPKSDIINTWTSYNRNSTRLSLREMERRRKLLFPAAEGNDNYCRIQEKVIGVTLKYDPNIPEIISQIIDASNYENSIKELLRAKKVSFESTMEYYHHRNLRTFQFFLSKVTYLLEQLKNINIEQDYYDIICNQVISETFTQAVKFKSNYQPPKEDYPWLITKQDTDFLSIKQYVETGTYDEEYANEVQKFQNELKANISSDDPYNLLHRQYYYQTQAWCEEQLEKILKQLESNKYPISFYGKIIATIQRLINLGFDEEYMNRTKKMMLANISKADEENLIDPKDVWFIEESEFKEKVIAIITDINEAIKNRSEVASRESVTDILSEPDWLDKLDRYINPTGLQYIQDMHVFSKAPAKQWLKNIHEASPRDIDDFREILSELYPNSVRRKSYFKDADTIKAIIEGLKKMEEEDLIKKACTGWLCAQFEEIVKIHEPQVEQETE